MRLHVRYVCVRGKGERPPPSTRERSCVLCVCGSHLAHSLDLRPHEQGLYLCSCLTHLCKPFWLYNAILSCNKCHLSQCQRQDVPKVSVSARPAPIRLSATAPPSLRRSHFTQRS